MLDQKFDDLLISSSTSSVKRKNAVENGVDGLSSSQSIFHKAHIARRRGGMQVEAGELCNDIVLCLKAHIGIGAQRDGNRDRHRL